MGFSIQDYLRDNKIELGKHEKAVGDTPYKGGHNDIRKTNYDVKLTKDGVEYYIPPDTGNRHWQDYLEWVAEGNTAEAAD